MVVFLVIFTQVSHCVTASPEILHLAPVTLFDENGRPTSVVPSRPSLVNLRIPSRLSGSPTFRELREPKSDEAPPPTPDVALGFSDVVPGDSIGSLLQQMTLREVRSAKNIAQEFNLPPQSQRDPYGIEVKRRLDNSMMVKQLTGDQTNRMKEILRKVAKLYGKHLTLDDWKLYLDEFFDEEAGLVPYLIRIHKKTLNDEFEKINKFYMALSKKRKNIRSILLAYSPGHLVEMYQGGLIKEALHEVKEANALLLSQLEKDPAYLDKMLTMDARIKTPTRQEREIRKAQKLVEDGTPLLHPMDFLLKGISGQADGSNDFTSKRSLKLIDQFRFQAQLMVAGGVVREQMRLNHEIAERIGFTPEESETLDEVERQHRESLFKDLIQALIAYRAIFGIETIPDTSFKVFKDMTQQQNLSHEEILKNLIESRNKESLVFAGFLQFVEGIKALYDKDEYRQLAEFYIKHLPEIIHLLVPEDKEDVSQSSIRKILRQLFEQYHQQIFYVLFIPEYLLPLAREIAASPTESLRFEQFQTIMRFSFLRMQNGLKWDPMFIESNPMFPETLLALYKDNSNTVIWEDVLLTLVRILDKMADLPYPEEETKQDTYRKIYQAAIESLSRDLSGYDSLRDKIIYLQNLKELFKSVQFHENSESQPVTEDALVNVYRSPEELNDLWNQSFDYARGTVAVLNYSSAVRTLMNTYGLNLSEEAIENQIRVMGLFTPQWLEFCDQLQKMTQSQNSNLDESVLRHSEWYYFMQNPANLDQAFFVALRSVDYHQLQEIEKLQYLKKYWDEYVGDRFPLLVVRSRHALSIPNSLFESPFTSLFSFTRRSA